MLFFVLADVIANFCMFFVAVLIALSYSKLNVLFLRNISTYILLNRMRNIHTYIESEYGKENVQTF